MMERMIQPAPQPIVGGPNVLPPQPKVQPIVKPITPAPKPLVIPPPTTPAPAPAGGADKVTMETDDGFSTFRVAGTDK